MSITQNLIILQVVIVLIKRRRLYRYIIVFCSVLALIPVLLVPVSAVNLEYANLFDYPCTAVQVHNTESVTVVDGFTDLYKFSTTQDISSGNTSIPVSWYFTAEWFSTSKMYVAFSFLCDNPSMIKSVTFGVGSSYFSCSKTVSDGLVTCYASVSGKLISPSFSISMQLAVLDSPYDLYFQFLSCTVSSISLARTHFIDSTDVYVANIVDGTDADRGQSGEVVLSADSCLSVDYPSAVSLGKPFLGNYNLQSPLPGACEPQYLVAELDFIVTTSYDDDLFYLLQFTLPGSLIYCNVEDENYWGIPATISSFVSDGANVEVTTDRAVHAYRVTGTQKVLKNLTSSSVVDGGTRSQIKYDPSTDSYTVATSYDYGSFIYDDVDSYLYTTESWESTAYGSSLVTSELSVSWNSSGSSEYYIKMGVLLSIDPSYTNSTYDIWFDGYSAPNVDRANVSVDAAYLGDIIGDKADELIYTIKQFFPNATAMQTVINDISNTVDDIHSVQNDAISSLDSVQLDYDSYRASLDNYITDDGDAFQSGFALVRTMIQVYIDAYDAGNMLWVFARIAFFGVAAYIVSRGRMPRGSGGS